ncbi:ABC transporter ATP-binding protein [Pyrobaculum sp. 3827-6]|uniref:ABC transporter ATP-binding protein n=1 Tax=Pyrobaculum sp. 3827-6 TaxID=2983604 RepID=UPI0021D99435|nr:ABC transporter ATP-binding protein [Pyrobaculum sp. 3827-6]MCU7786861.1 ABC transporter ATP-binding protein [Pyrobaculum sp. 3827-6]
MTVVRLEKLRKVFDNRVVAVDDVDLTVNDGEILAVLGPSGCGKTTLLRLVAGLEEPTSGRIYFDDRDVTHLPTQQRNTAVVPQTWALWPHMTVFENVAYGLRLMKKKGRKMTEAEIKRRVGEVLELVDLSGLEERRPYQLSGGQQQRVALARALVVQPEVLLLDEPLANLDAKLRVELREEVRRIAKKLSITTIYVTHDQEEAFAVADRIAVMNAGRVMQVGTPEEIYHRPANLFVATFVGRSNVLKGRVVEQRGEAAVVDAGFPIHAATPHKLVPGDEVTLVIRPEDVYVGGGRLRCELMDVVFLGRYYQTTLNCGGVALKAEGPKPPAAPGEGVAVEIARAWAFKT